MARRLLFVLLSLTACGSEEQAEARRAPPPARVEVAAVRTDALRVERRYLGEVRSLEDAIVGASASGEVVAVLVREGERVAAGDVLVRIDAATRRASLASVRAARDQITEELSQAQREQERLRGAGRNIVAEVEIERSASQVTALRAQLARADAQLRESRQALAEHRVVAAFPGVVSRRIVSVGDYVNIGQAMMELVSTDRAEVLVRVEPELLASVERGMSVTIEGGDASARGHIDGIVPALEARTRTAQLRVAVEEEAPWLLAGSAVNVAITIERALGEGEWVVPRDALVYGVAGARLFVVRDGSAVSLDVEIIEQSEARVLVRAELESDDSVVTRGNDRLRPGQGVTRQEATESPAEDSTDG
ncbi:MAG: efflux RND transporter periplasmic adaptor subunit [Polyangiales bacterium]